MGPRKDQEVTDITTLFRNLGSGAPREGADDHTLPLPPPKSQTYSLRQATTPSIHLPPPGAIPGVGGESHLPGSETPPTIPRRGPGSGPNPADAATHQGTRRQYELLRQFAQGGCGEVWEGSQVVFPRIVALKKIRPDLLAAYVGDQEMKQQVYRSFLQEALTTAVLEHPNIVPVYDFHMDSTGEPLLSMRLIRGRRWDQMIHDDRNMPRPEYLERHLPILVDVAQAVAYAHSKGVIHRDLKPSQVMIGEFGEVYLMDWGLALVVDEDLFFRDFPDLRVDCVAPTRSANPPLGGTPAYMAPEQAEMDPWKLGYFTDVFLLGSTFYYMLTGLAPRRSTQPELDASGLLALPIDPPRILRPEWDIPPELADICMKAINVDPTKRHGSAREFVEALQSWVTGASKRRESEGLTVSAAELLARARGDYGNLTECQSSLIRALGLWPENREAERLLQACTRTFAESALQKDDLNLARLMASRLRDHEAREEIMNEVIATERLAKLAEAEAEEAEVHIRELRASGDLVQQELLNLELRATALQGAANSLIAALAAIVGAMESAPPQATRTLVESLLQLHTGLLAKGGDAARLYQRAADFATRAGLTEEARKLNLRAESLA
ncbi:protein kinase [bacterium]|nr:protein kinase [bacterium]